MRRSRVFKISILLNGAQLVCFGVYVMLNSEKGIKKDYWKQNSRLEASQIHVATGARSEINQTTSDGNIFRDVLKLCQDINIFLRKGNHHMTDPRLSRITNIESDLNGKVTVSVVTYTTQNKSKGLGGDVLFLWAKQVGGDGRVAGDMYDHGNGKYTGTLKIPWSGESSVHVKVASFLENTCLKFRSIEMYGTGAYATMGRPGGIKATYLNGNLSEETPCLPSENIYLYTDVCNFTKRNGNMSWFCGHPKQRGIECQNIVEFNSGPFGNDVNPVEKTVKPNDGVFADNASLNIKSQPFTEPSIKCTELEPVTTWSSQNRISSGFYLNKHWHSFSCKSSFNNTVNEYKKCLHNRTLYILGDSTIRQYGTYLLVNVLRKGGINLMNMKGQAEVYHPNVTVENYGISIRFIKHAMPFHYPHLKPVSIKSIYSEIDILAQSDIPDNRLILLTNVFAHFQAFSFGVFNDRVEKLALALRGFLQVKPKAKVFVRSPHFYIDRSDIDAKTYLIYIETMYNIFKSHELQNKVIYLDAWSISIAHETVPLHPVKEAYESQMEQFMAFLC